MTGGRFSLDSNILIEAAETYYGFDIAPLFWEGLVAHGIEDRLFMIDRVDKEINDGQLRNWIDESFSDCIKKCNDPQTLMHYADLMQWAQKQPFKDAAKSEFATVADAWLIAHAKAIGATLVTRETYDANCRRRVKIPNACHYLNVPCVDTYAMIRALGIRLGP